MRIAHFLSGRCDPAGHRGPDRTVYYLSEAQASLGHAVVIVSLSARVSVTPPGVAGMACPPARNPFRLPGRLTEGLDAWRPDIVHLHSVYVPQCASLARHLRRRGVPYVVTPHGGLSPYVMRRNPHLKWPYKFLVELPYLNRAAAVHAIGDADDIRRYGVRVPVVVAPNGIDADAIPRHAERGLLRRRFPLTSGKRVFTFIGRLDPFHKGLDILFRAFAKARASARDAVLFVVGPDRRGSFARLGKLARDLGVDDGILFWGPAYGEEKFSVLFDSDVFVHTSRYEGCSFSVLEALACGKPCLLTAAADPVGAVAARGAGVVVAPTVNAVSDALIRLSSASAGTLAAYAEQARRLAEREFSWRPITRTVIEGYIRHGGSHLGDDYRDRAATGLG